MVIKHNLEIKEDERRKGQRIKIPLRFDYSWLSGKRIFQKKFTQDISEGGIKLKLDEPVKTGQRLKVKLYFPEDAKPIVIESKIAWCKKRKIRKKEIFETGIKYLKVPSKDRERFAFLFCETMLNFFTGFFKPQRVSVCGPESPKKNSKNTNIRRRR